MPLAALNVVDPSHSLTAEISDLLVEIVATDAGPTVSPSPGSALEVHVASGGRLGAEALRRIADPATISCPDCGGVLSEMRGEKPLRYRCQIGDAQTAEVLSANSDEIAEAMRIALRVTEERVALMSAMAREAREM